MPNRHGQFTRGVNRLILFFLFSCALPASSAQQSPASGDSATGMALYQALGAFDLTGGSAKAENVVLQRDRVELRFDGMFYFEAPLAGRIRGAVFLGNGKVHADVPNSAPERDNLRRLLKAGAVDSDFRTAVLRFTDDTLEALHFSVTPGDTAPAEAQKLATELSRRLLQETGANVPARMVVSILNQESPGFFLAQFDKGARGRFYLLLDQQGRLPVAHFGLNAGEKGLLFAHDSDIFYPDVWMAFYSLPDYQRGIVEYSDTHNIVDVRRNTMQVDVREWKHLKLESSMEMVARADGVRAIPLVINETLGAYDDVRLKKAMRLKSARLKDGGLLAAIQEGWDGSVTLLLPAAIAKGQTIEPILEFEGEYLIAPDTIRNIYYVRGDSWYPRHGYLQRSSFDITFRHRKGTHVASVGARVREERTPEGDMVTEWKMDQPVALVTFAIGEFELHTDIVKMETGGELPIDFYSMPGSVMAIKEDFIMAELSNCVRYFSTLFGAYPYPRFGAAFHPYGFGQGFPSLLMIPSTDRSNKYTYSFIAHETSHQWWGDVVAWRSYRDQWLSEGFADYSGILYTALRDKDRGSPRELLHLMHEDLLNPPHTLQGIGKGRLVDVGPIILGHRLNTRETLGAYTTLIYEKGALVLRMLDFLFANPVTGDDKAFFDMMKDFVHRYANGWASTENFRDVANEHFVRTPIAQKYQLKNLNWFFQQWVYESALPSYELSYRIEDQPDGTAIVRGTVTQRDAPDNWFMPLPLVVHYGKEKIGHGTVYAQGPQTPFSIHLPSLPDTVELDPDRWVLSDKTKTIKTQ